MTIHRSFQSRDAVSNAAIARIRLYSCNRDCKPQRRRLSKLGIPTFTRPFAETLEITEDSGRESKFWEEAMPRDQTAVAIEKQTEVLKNIAEGIAEANELARAQLEQSRDLKPETADPETRAAGG